MHRYYLNGNTAFRLILYLKPGIPYKPTYPPEYAHPDLASPATTTSGAGLMDEDLFARQAAQMQIQDAEGERHDVMRGAS